MFDQTNPRLHDYAAGSSMGSHEHDEASLSIVVRGGFTERLGRAERDYARGHVAFFPAGLSHAQAFGPRGARQIIFRPQAEWIEYLADCKVVLDEAPHVRSAIFHQLGERLIGEVRTGDDFSALACEGLMLEVVAAFAREGAKAAGSSRPPAWLCAARDFMHENVATSLTLAEIASAAGRHEIHLAREFRRYFGLPVGDYLRRLRVERAAQLLQRSRLSLSEVALDCGFSSHSHLCRTFQAHQGMTPSQYRRQTRDHLC